MQDRDFAMKLCSSWSHSVIPWTEPSSFLWWKSFFATGPSMAQI